MVVRGLSPRKILGKKLIHVDLFSFNMKERQIIKKVKMKARFKKGYFFLLPLLSWCFLCCHEFLSQIQSKGKISNDRESEDKTTDIGLKSGQ